MGSRALLLPALLGLAAVSPRPASAQPHEVNATVIAARESRVYLLAAAADSTALIEGARLTFQYRGKAAATGTVLRSFQDGLAVAALTSGSLGKIKKLDRVRTLAEPPLSTRPTVLRIGFPSGHRPCLLFSCPEPSLRPPHSPSQFQDSIEVLPDGAQRIVGGGYDFPETLIVRRFDDAADQEIALERGDLDVGVFWPGELSAGARRNLDWGGTRVVLDRGLVVLSSRPRNPPPSSGPLAHPEITDQTLGNTPPVIFSELNQQVFRGDLEPWTNAGIQILFSDHDHAKDFAVDSTMPGQLAIERFLNHGSPRSADPRWRVSYRHLPVGRDGSVIPGSAGDVGVVPVFAIRCAVVIRPEWRPLLSNVAAARIANMSGCPNAGGSP